MYTDQFKTKQSLTYYAFDILKSYAKGYDLKYDELKEKLVIHINNNCKISIQVNDDKIIPKGFQTFDNENNLICSYSGFNCGIQPLFKDVEQYIKEDKKIIVSKPKSDNFIATQVFNENTLTQKYEQLTLFDLWEEY